MDEELIRAVEDGDIENIRILLDAGANPNILDIYGSTALMIASLRGHIEIVRLLLERGAQTDWKDNNDGYTALMIASIYSNTEMVRLLLKHGTEVNLQSHYGNTALILASRGGDMNIVRLLLKHGANPNIQNNLGETALTLASDEGHTDVVELIEQHIAQQPAQHKASRNIQSRFRGYRARTNITLKEKQREAASGHPLPDYLIDEIFKHVDNPDALEVTRRMKLEELACGRNKTVADCNNQNNCVYSIKHGLCIEEDEMMEIIKKQSTEKFKQLETQRQTEETAQADKKLTRFSKQTGSGNKNTKRKRKTQKKKKNKKQKRKHKTKKKTYII